MKQFRWHASVFMVLLSTCAPPVQSQAINPANRRQMEQSARDVLARVVGARASQFILAAAPMGTDHDAFEVEAADGKVVVKGNSAVALVRGAYHYLRNAARCQVAWSGAHLNLPRRLPDYPTTRVASPYGFRLYYNVCAFGYTTAFWGWREWEKELDWMALHGINMPLAMVGQEAIWQRVWNSYGITNAELKEYFTGPAFLPWHRMGNVNKHDGPLPQEWLDQSVDLQKKIVRRMKELGMQPIVPAFSGFVPPSFETHHPEAITQKLGQWCDFGKEYQAQMLSAESPLFPEIGRRFIEEYRKEYGQFRYYLSDSFNEMEVPVTERGRYDELAQYGEAVYKSIVAGDPNGTWVMQGWLFYNASSFWDKPSVQALLSRVPNDRMLIVDLAEELWQGWKKHEGFYGKKWIYSMIHNFGGNNPMNGAMKFFAGEPAKALHSSDRGALAGIGFSPEGIENNEVIYELLTDVAWSDAPIDLNRWLEDYCVSRYGGYPEAMKESWQLLLASVYTRPQFNVRFAFQMQPSLNPKGEARGGGEVALAAERFLSCAEELGRSQLYRNDLVEILTQDAGLTVDSLLKKAGEFQQRSQPAYRDTMAAQALLLMKSIDRLVSVRPDRRLERWVEFARQWGNDENSRNYYESDAKRQVTVWGGLLLAEYAAKVWSGLIRDYYAPRWQYYYQHLREGKTFDIRSWEEAWIVNAGNGTRQDIPSDAIEEAVRFKNYTDRVKATYLPVH